MPWKMVKKLKLDLKKSLNIDYIYNKINYIVFKNYDSGKNSKQMLFLQKTMKEMKQIRWNDFKMKIT